MDGVVPTFYAQHRAESSHISLTLDNFCGSDASLVITRVATRRRVGRCWSENDSETKDSLIGRNRHQAPKDEGKQEGEQEDCCVHLYMFDKQADETPDDLCPQSRSASCARRMG
jgi:hypothetical protein